MFVHLCKQIEKVREALKVQVWIFQIATIIILLLTTI